MFRAEKCRALTPQQKSDVERVLIDDYTTAVHDVLNNATTQDTRAAIINKVNNFIRRQESSYIHWTDLPRVTKARYTPAPVSER